MVGCSLTHRGEELLGQRKGLEEYARSGSTFGIPFLHPWANRLAGFGYAVGGQEVELDRDSPLLRIEEHGLPIHGLRPQRAGVGGRGARGRPRARPPSSTASGSRASRSRTGWRSRSRSPTTALTLETTLTPTSATPVPISLRLPPVPRRCPARRGRSGRSTCPVERRLLLDDNLIPTGEGETPGLPPRRARGPLAGRRLRAARAPAPVHGHGGRAHARRRVPRGLHARAGVRPRGPRADLLRADDRARPTR